MIVSETTFDPDDLNINVQIYKQLEILGPVTYEVFLNELASVLHQNHDRITKHREMLARLLQRQEEQKKVERELAQPIRHSSFIASKLELSPVRLVLLEDAGAYSLTVRLDGGFERDLTNTAHLPLFMKEDNIRGQGCDVEIKSSTKDLFVLMRKWDRNSRLFDEEVYAAG